MELREDHESCPHSYLNLSSACFASSSSMVLQAVGHMQDEGCICKSGSLVEVDDGKLPFPSVSNVPHVYPFE